MPPLNTVTSLIQTRLRNCEENINGRIVHEEWSKNAAENRVTLFFW